LSAGVMIPAISSPRRIPHACGGQVVRPSGQRPGPPQDRAVEASDDLHVHAVAEMLAE